MRVTRLATFTLCAAFGCAAIFAACTPASVSSPPTASSTGPTVTLPGGGSSLPLTASGAGSTATIIVSETGYTGNFSATTSNRHVVTVSPATVAASAESDSRHRDATGSATFIATAVGAGSAAISISDNSGNATSIPVTVTSPSGSPASSPTPTVSPTATASPAPTASPTPTPPPPGVLSVNPASIQIYGTGTSNAAAIFVQETGYSGSFAQTNTCSSIATIAPASATGPTATFTAVGVNAGTCSTTFSDASSQHTTISITVTTSGFVVQSAH
jgi:hypothetical protein